MHFIYFLLAIYFINFFFGLKLLFSQNLNLSNLIYVMLLSIIFPFFTPLIYLILFFNENVRKNLLRKKVLDETIITDVNSDHIYAHNDLTVYTNGNKLFDSIFEEIDHAKEFIHINFYTFNTDKIGKTMIAKLEEKLKDGVEVVILYDRIGSIKMKKRFLKRYKKLGGKLHPFMSLSKKMFPNLNYRNHRKIIIIDNKVSFIGGFNVGDMYLGRNKKMGKWVDCHLKIVGDATTQIEKRFLVDYTYASKKKIQINHYLKKYDFTGTKKVQITSSGVDVSNINYIENKFLELIYKAEDYIYIQTPYLILNDAMIRALKFAAFKGVQITIMLPNKKDHPFVLEATKNYAKMLIEDNISIFLFNQNAFLHSKVFISDDKYLSIGTTNFDIRSFKYDLEINTFIYDEAFLLRIKDIFLKQITYCEKLHLDQLSTMKLIKEYLCKLLSSIL